MSSNEIFAAHMWPWPDPMIKRDTSGRILFINAAFLRLYGGQVADWQGNTVSGWPAPQGTGAPNRFETRLPSPEGEMVYDWIEYTLADTTSLAIARDVTALLPVPEPDPAHSLIPPHVEQNFETPQQAPLQDPFAHAVVAAPVQASLATEATALAAPIEAAVMEAAAPIAPPVQEEKTSVVNAPLPMQHVPLLSEAAEMAAEPVDAVIDTAAQTEAVNEVARDERRALPAENNDAVLGANWRDAVIAKAVGSALPSAENETKTENEEPAPSKLLKTDGPLRILLAEDNAINALLTRTLLEADGCDVEVVEDGVLAVEAMKNQSYDMIFMDMRMPNMDGLEATRKIRALPNVAQNLPIVALTANAFDDDRNACFDSGMNDFMTKPVSAEELSDMVDVWVRKKAKEEAA